MRVYQIATYSYHELPDEVKEKIDFDIPHSVNHRDDIPFININRSGEFDINGEKVYFYMDERFRDVKQTFAPENQNK